MSEQPDASFDFLAEDYSFTAQLLRDYARLGPPKMFQAVCSNNLNIIMAALEPPRSASHERLPRSARGAAPP